MSWTKDILVTETEPIHSSNPITTTNNTKEISELKINIFDLKENIQQLQDSLLLHRKREALAGQQSLVSLNSFDMDFIDDFQQKIGDSHQY